MRLTAKAIATRNWPMGCGNHYEAARFAGAPPRHMTSGLPDVAEALESGPDSGRHREDSPRRPNGHHVL